MRNKKVLSTVVTSALVATTMAMPVMAAETGNVNVDVSTKTGVLRVAVPTNMRMEIDQFEITQEGAQIASGEFDMTNLSEMDVKVGITSTATLDTGVSLVSSREAAEKSTGNEAWLAVAAMTGASSYDDKTTDDGDASTTTDVENYWDLTEANANVTTFASDTKKAEQTFYLEKATGNTEYKLAVPDAATQVDKTFAQFYKLTAQIDPTDDDGLQALVNANDIYVAVTANVGNDGETLTKIEKGSTVAASTYDGDNTYYVAEDAASTPAAGSVYAYAAKATAGTDGKAGFKYVGKLSNAKESWTTVDIKGVAITYTITGVTATNYSDVAEDCTYGLYTPVTGPQVSMSPTGLITVTGLTADVNYKSMVIADANGNAQSLNVAPVTWSNDEWSAENGGHFTVQLGDQWMSYLKGKGTTAKVTVTLTDNKTVDSETVTLSN